MADYQSTNLGDGWMRTVTFDAEAQTFRNRTFSVKHDRTWWVDDAMENFTVPITREAPERSVATDYVGVTGRTTRTIASFDDVRAGRTVTARAGHLEPGTRYSWFAEATDAEGHTAISPVWDFTTRQKPEHLGSTPTSAGTKR